MTYIVPRVIDLESAIKGNVGQLGVVNPQCWITLTPENVKDIHLQGGSILVSDRGNPPHLEMAPRNS